MDPCLLFCLGYFSSSTHFDLVTRLAQKLLRTILRRGGNINDLLSNTGLFLSNGNRYFFLFQRRCSCFNSPVSGVKISRWKFLICTPLHQCLQFFWCLGADVFSWISVCNANTFASCADCILILHRLSKISSDGILDTDSGTSSYLISNSWILSSWRVTQNKSTLSNAVSWAPVSRK